MADSIAYPKVGLKPWAMLRARAASAPSTRFSGQLVAALLGMTPDSATGNVIRPMRQLGLLDDEGSLTQRGNKWRLDASYSDACQEILDEIYPADLAAFTDESGKADKSAVSTYFQHQGLGASNARQMAATYAMIATKTPPDSAQFTADRDSSATTKKPTAPKPTKKASAAPEPEAQVNASLPTPPADAGTSPQLHIDIQIHIPATANPDQIDQIFASMAKHLYSR